WRGNDYIARLNVNSLMHSAGRNQDEGRCGKPSLAALTRPQSTPKKHARNSVARAIQGHSRPKYGKNPQPVRNGILAMKPVAIRAAAAIAAMAAVGLLGAPAVRAQTASPAAAHIETYYRELLATIKQAGRLSVRERDKRFAPAITAAFDLATMTRLAVGPPWRSFTPEQKAAVQEAFTRFIIADYASQIKDYSGETFVVDPQTSPEARGGGEVVKTRLVQPGGRVVNINYLVRGGRVIDLYLNGTISDLATRREEFSSIIAAGGADALIKRLQERTASLLSR
ncbi:MAG TPA: ABC transporter substrate-binding protein, partial [Xanthobacteraceae bacterium]|nr:ABC transporter substrate-binding protein [Xanthobacteraceae bacterium]